MKLQEHVPLAAYTTFGIGGPARWFAEAETEADVLEAVEFARRGGLSLFVLGGGSNLLVSDVGYPGVVLHIALRGIVEQEDGGFAVAAGEDWDAFVDRAIAGRCAGVECLAGIPGTVGGTPVQNVGAYGQEVSETIRRVRAFDLEANVFVELSREECEFAYRRSLFNTSARGRYVVTRVDYALEVNGRPRLSYADLKRHFAGHDSTPSLAEVASAVRQIRRSKGMFLVAGDPDCASAGSFFKNPVITQSVFNKIAEGTCGVVPSYPADPGRVKLPAAWLIDQAGFRKGFALGNAGISARHTLALINRGGATAADILRLSEAISTSVEAKFGIRLEREPVWLG